MLREQMKIGLNFFINALNKWRYDLKIKKINLELAYKKALNDINFEYGVEDLNILVGNYVGNHKKLQNLCGFKFKKIESLNA